MLTNSPVLICQLSHLKKFTNVCVIALLKERPIKELNSMFSVKTSTDWKRFFLRILAFHFGAEK